MNLNITTIKLLLETPLSPGEATRVRGYFANQFEGNSLFHNINEDGSYIYRYPRIQYKIIDKRVYIIGVEDGVSDLEKMWFSLKDNIILGDEKLTVFDSSISTQKATFGDTDSKATYEFVTPWLALNVKNYNKYNRLGDMGERKSMLSRILIGNLISISKSLDYRVTGRLKCEDLTVKEFPCKLKGVDMLGFLGTFSINFLVPDLLGLGMSVSRGFGTINGNVSLASL